MSDDAVVFFARDVIGYSGGSRWLIRRSAARSIFPDRFARLLRQAQNRAAAFHHFDFVC
jgi:hypothetical protein